MMIVLNGMMAKNNLTFLKTQTIIGMKYGKF
jgi:hypothetical protein